MNMHGWRLLTALLIIYLWQVPLWATAETLAGDKADLRVLIDISGSMKQNDPKNLRRPALRLLVGLLPKDTRAGVWTFGQYVNMQIPLGEVDQAWKQKARVSSAKIGSPGQFTHIEDALKRATEDWTTPPGAMRRSVILLTDGMVDISRDPAKNQSSRQRILTRILPRLQKSGVTVHTIALSKNADHELMRELAESTGGWYEQVVDANQLQKVFLRIFEKVGRPDAVPLKDNRFNIDASITEATVLVFHKPGAEPTLLIPPGAEPFGAEQAPKSVSWHRDEGYDMLTISDPQPGEWAIRAEVDPDNRVMVVTDLKMQTSQVPNQLIQGQSLSFEVSFTDHGKLIRKPAFLKVVDIAAVQLDENGESEPRPLLDDGAEGDAMAGDGHFSVRFDEESLHRGMGQLIVNVRARTLEREKRLTYEVVAPVNLEITPAGESGRLSLAVIPDERLVDKPSVETEVWLEDVAGQTSPVQLQAGADGVRQGELDIMSFSGMRKVVVKARAKALSGESLEYLDSPAEVEGLLPQAATPKATQPSPAVQEPEPEVVNESVPESEPEPVQQEVTEEDDWVMTSIWLALANLLLLLVVGGGFWWLRRRNQRNLVTLVDEQAPAVASAPEEQAA